MYGDQNPVTEKETDTTPQEVTQPAFGVELNLTELKMVERVKELKQ